MNTPTPSRSSGSVRRHPQDLRADEKLARDLGVNAVPCTVLGGRLAIPGAATVSAYADAITQALTTGDPQ